MIVKRGLTVKRRPDAGSILNPPDQRLWAEDLALQAQEEERQRIADAIHDHSIQTVTAASLRLQQFRRMLREPQQLALLTELESLLEATSVQLRQVMFDLHPPALDGSGVAAAIRETLEPLRTERGIAFRVKSDLSREPSAGRRIALFRIIEPLLAEAGARSPKLIAVELHEHEGGWLAVVRHDGGEGARESSGTGPAWARAKLRAQLNGGWTRFEVPPEGGVRLTCWIPELAGQAGDAAMGREAA
jgi:signal transduction histidine kinase